MLPRLSGLALALTLGLATASAEPLKELRAAPLELSGRVLDFETGDVNGDGKRDIVVAHLIDDGALDDSGRKQRLLSVFLQQAGRPTWKRTPDLTLPVPRDAVLFALGDFLPTKGIEVALLSYSHISLRATAEEGAMWGRELKVEAAEGGFFDFPADGGLFLWTLSPKIGAAGDGLLFPTKTGYLVYARDGAGGFASKGRVNVPSVERFGPPLETKFLNRLLTYFSRLPRVVSLDMNGDGRLDLVGYREKGLAIFEQDAEGRFTPEPQRTFPLQIVEKAAERSKKEGKEDKDVFESVRLALRDLNGDGKVDLVATKTIGEIGVFESLRSQVLVFLAGAKGLQDEEPARIINLKGISLFPEFTDFNGDRDVDIVLSSLRVDLVTNIKRAILDSVSTTYAVYLYRGGERVYSDEADISRDVDVELDLVEKQGQVRLTSFEGDFNGDGLKDMLTVSARDRLRIVPGKIESSFFSGQYLTLDDDGAQELGVPTSPTLRVLDLDGDGRDELIFAYTKSDDPERRVLRVVEEVR